MKWGHRTNGVVTDGDFVSQCRNAAQSKLSVTESFSMFYNALENQVLSQNS